MLQIYYAGPKRQPVMVNDTEIPALIANGTLRAETMVWMEGMANWKPLKDVRPELLSGGGRPVTPAIPSSEPQSTQPQAMNESEASQLIELLKRIEAHLHQLTRGGDGHVGVQLRLDALDDKLYDIKNGIDTLADR